MNIATVVNLATQAPYEYHNYGFTGFATQGDRQFAVQADGFYELVGDTDADASIDAWLTTGLLDFGNPALKTLAAAYLGYQADAPLHLTVTVGHLAGSQVMTYDLATTSAAPATARLKLGKGVKARYWQLRLANTTGGNFEIEALDILPVVLQRRI